MEKPTEEVQEEVIAIGTALGADAGISVQSFLVYIPNKDKDDQEFGNQRRWVLDAIQMLSEINGGATAIPSEGAWLNDQSKIILEDPVIVYSYVKDLTKFAASLPRIREFLHRMGRVTKQGEVAFEFAEKFYRIRTFDPV